VWPFGSVELGPFDSALFGVFWRVLGRNVLGNRLFWKLVILGVLAELRGQACDLEGSRDS
jgi:hypothetical protein